MRTAYVDKVWLKDKEVVRGIVVAQETIDDSLETIFDKKERHIIQFLSSHENTKANGGFHLVTRFCQFVVLFNHSHQEVIIDGEPFKLGITIELMHFGTSDNVNDIFDYNLKLRGKEWEEGTREEIIIFAREIKNDYDKTWFEIAELKSKDFPDKLTSFL